MKFFKRYNIDQKTLDEFKNIMYYYMVRFQMICMILKKKQILL